MDKVIKRTASIMHSRVAQIFLFIVIDTIFVAPQIGWQLPEAQCKQPGGQGENLKPILLSQASGSGYQPRQAQEYSQTRDPVRASAVNPEQMMPLKVYITQGLDLPLTYAGKQMQDCLCDPQFYKQLSVCKGYDPSWNLAVTNGINWWHWAVLENRLQYDFVSEPQDADIIIFWSSDLGANGKNPHGWKENCDEIINSFCERFANSVQGEAHRNDVRT